MRNNSGKRPGKNPPLILASGSAARSHILTQCGISHTIDISCAPEIMDQTKSARCNVLANALHKASAVAKKYKTGIVIGADTLVVCDKRLFGKARSINHAQTLLTFFSGKKIKLYTGLYVIDVSRNKHVSAAACSRICVQKLNRADITRYMKKLVRHDKAGGFTVEGIGSLIFDAIEGSFYNILGLPTITLNALFKKLGYHMLEFVD